MASSGGVQFGAAGEITVPITVPLDKMREQLDRAEKQIGSRMKKLSGRLDSVGKTLSTRISAPVAAGFAAAIKVGADFDDAMTKSLAIMGDVNDKLRKEMSKTARKVGKETTFSAKQAADAYFFLASAGLDAKQSMASMNQVAEFAQAGNFDLARATDLLTDSQSALGLSVDDAQQNMQNMARVSDVLVGANTLANASVEQFGKALTSKAGPAARAAGKSIEETVAVLAAFADQGVKAERAGERLNIILSQLPKVAQDNQIKFEKFGIEIFDSNGKLKNMADIVAEFEQALGGMSDKQQAAAFSQLKVNEGLADGIRMLLGTSDQVREYERKLNDMGGVTAEVSANQLDSFSAKLKLIQGRVEDLGIRIFNLSEPMLRKKLIPALDSAITKLDNLVSWFNDLDPTTQSAITAFGTLVVTLGPLLILGGKIAGMLGSLAALMGGGVVAAIGSLAAAVVLWITRWDEIMRGIRELWDILKDFSENFLQKFIDGWNIIWQDAKDVVGNFVLDTINEFKWLRDNAFTIFKTLRDYVVNPFQSAYDTIVGNSIVPDMVSEIGFEFDRMTGLITEPTDRAINAMIRKFEDGSAAGDRMAQDIQDTSRAIQDAMRIRMQVRPEEDVVNRMSSLDQLATQFPEILTPDVLRDKLIQLWDQFGVKGMEVMQQLQPMLDQVSDTMKIGIGDAIKKIGGEEMIFRINKMGEAVDKFGNKADAATDDEGEGADESNEPWRKKAKLLGQAGELIGSFGDEFQATARVVKAGAQIMQIAISNVNPALKAMQIATVAVQAAFGLMGDKGEEEVSRMDQLVKDLGEALQDWADQLADAIVQAVKTGQLQISDLVDQILTDLLQLGIQFTITDPLAQFIGDIVPFKSGGVVSDRKVQPFADGGVVQMQKFFQGGVINQNTVTPFASGGVVDGPTLFGLKSGLGLMGEEDAEGIFPLKRMRDGSLGVSAEGMGGGPQVQIIDQRAASEPPLQVQRTREGMVDALKVFIRSTAAEAMADGEFDPVLRELLKGGRL